MRTCQKLNLQDKDLNAMCETEILMKNLLYNLLEKDTYSLGPNLMGPKTCHKALNIEDKSCLPVVMVTGQVHVFIEDGVSLKKYGSIIRLNVIYAVQAYQKKKIVFGQVVSRFHIYPRLKSFSAEWSDK